MTFAQLDPSAHAPGTSTTLTSFEDMLLSFPRSSICNSLAVIRAVISYFHGRNLSTGCIVVISGTVHEWVFGIASAWERELSWAKGLQRFSSATQWDWIS